MKLKLLLLALVVSTSTFAILPSTDKESTYYCDYTCKHGLQKDFDRYAEQRRIMQQGINESVAKQNEVDKMIRQHKGELNHTEMCKMVSIYQSMDFYGNIQPVKYIEIYEKCLKNK